MVLLLRRLSYSRISPNGSVYIVYEVMCVTVSVVCVLQLVCHSMVTCVTIMTVFFPWEMIVYDVSMCACGCVSTRTCELVHVCTCGHERVGMWARVCEWVHTHLLVKKMRNWSVCNNSSSTLSQQYNTDYQRWHCRWDLRPIRCLPNC